MFEVVHSDTAPSAIGPYSQALFAGDMLFCSGQTPIDPSTGHLVAGGVDVQAAQALSNITEVLRAGGLSCSDVVKTTIFLTTMADFGAVNVAYANHFGEHRPARSTVAVAELPLGARVEIEAIAVRGTSR